MRTKPSLHTILSPGLLHLYDITNSIVVIIDVFRATSTIAAALFHGATKVVPVSSVADCISMGKTLNAVTAGERDGKIIEGLQHGNSPSEYPRSFIEGKTLVITTTNGTRLIQLATDQKATGIITGSFPNISAVCEYLVRQKKNVILGCSAWKDRFNLEDTLFAGAVIKRIRENFTIECDSSLMAAEMYALHQHDLSTFIRKTAHWKRLSAYNLQADMEWCITEDIAHVLPLYTNGILQKG
ncbi:MAG: 2-phosphosulfolactate phosphatase [Bacteroidetes bacterium]|nr:2-phosphosulfolactate phosphatase [Bacteroidota bacterium]